MAGVEEEIPQSPLLVAFVVSHMVPWLRCGIPRGLLRFECGEAIPDELLAFEPFRIPAYCAPRLEFTRKEIADVFEEEDVPEIPVLQPAEPEILPTDDTSEGEYKAVKEEAPPELPPKQKLHRPVVRKKRKTVKKVKPRQPPSIPEPPSRGPTLRLLQLNPSAPTGYPQYPPPPAPYRRPVMPAPAASGYNTVWDFDPSHWRKQQAKERAAPSRRDVEVQEESPRKDGPVIVVRQELPGKEERSEDSLELSDLINEMPREVTRLVADPFPLDKALQERYHRAIAEGNMEIESLPPPEKFVKPKPVARPKVYDPECRSVEVMTEIPCERSFEEERHEWRPPLVRMSRGDRVLGTRELTVSHVAYRERESFRDSTDLLKKKKLRKE
jgi:hypothetical protein